MKAYFDTNHKACNIQLELHSEQACEVRLVGMSKQRNTLYFDRFPIQLIAGGNVVEIPLPMSPKRLWIQGARLQGEGKVRLMESTIAPLPKPNNWTAEERDFLALAQYISQHIGYLRNGVYYSPKRKIKLRLATVLRDSHGTIVDTPARVNVYKPYLEVSHKMRQYTVAMRMFILCHEYGHYLHHSFDELLADRVGVELYLKAGYPQSEAYYALSDILKNDTQGNQRLGAIRRFLQGHNTG